MDKISVKSFIFITLFLIFGIGSYEISAGNVQGGTSSSEKGTSSSKKILPIILMKEFNVLELPTDVSYSKKLPIIYSRKTMKFHAEKGLHEIYFCAADKNDQKKIQKARKRVSNGKLSNRFISEKCLFEKSIGWMHYFRGEISCKNEPEPFISQVYEPIGKNSEENNKKVNNLDFTWTSCGPKKDKKLYRYEYQLWLKSVLLNSKTQLTPPLTKSMAHPKEKNIVDLEIYRFCYDDTTQELLYTKHALLSPKLLLSKNFKEVSKSYDYEISKFDNEELDFTKYKKIYDQVNGLNTKNNQSIDEARENNREKLNLTDYKMQKLVPHEDFALSLWQKTAFHHVNQNLMNKELIESWNHINTLIHKHVQIFPNNIDIYTGTFNISTKENKDKMSETTGEIKIPEVWIKILHWSFHSDEFQKHINEGVVIIANNHMNMELEDTISKYCEYIEMYRYTSNDEDIEEQNLYSYIRSCNLTSKFEELFGLDLEINNRFILGNLSNFKTKIIPGEKKSDPAGSNWI